MRNQYAIVLTAISYFYLVRDINSPIHNFLSKYLFIVFPGLKSSNLFLILRGHQNAFHSIIDIIITPNFVREYPWIGENKLVN